jgi:hypothetical protein
MEEDVDPEIGARQKVHQAPVDGESDFDSYRKVIQDASYKYAHLALT